MLDDLKYIYQKDKSDALGVVEKQWEQLTTTYWPENVSVGKEIKNVVVAGMGGSALAANMIETWPDLTVPFEVWKTYGAPNYINENTLFVASSYSGNTEETLSAIEEAQKHKCQIAVVSAGGTLADIAEEKGYPLFRIPEGYQPRMAVFFSFAALVQLFSSYDLTDVSFIDELRGAAFWLREEAKKFNPTVETKKNPAKRLAQELAGSSVVIYAGPRLAPAAYKWKISINENANTVAWWNVLPEYNHNEFLGWTSHPIQKPYKIVELRSSLDHPQIQKRFELSDRLLSGKRPSPEIVEVVGATHLRQLLWSIQFGDYVSVYLAIMNGLDPTEIYMIDKLKQELLNSAAAEQHKQI